MSRTIVRAKNGITWCKPTVDWSDEQVASITLKLFYRKTYIFGTKGYSVTWSSMFTYTRAVKPCQTSQKTRYVSLLYSPSKTCPVTVNPSLKVVFPLDKRPFSTINQSKISVFTTRGKFQQCTVCSQKLSLGTSWWLWSVMQCCFKKH